MRYSGLALFLVSSLALVACFDTPTPAIAFQCGPADECPDSYECRDDGCCHLIGSSQNTTCELAPDAQPPTPDAMPPLDMMPDMSPMPDAAPGPVLISLTPPSMTISAGQTGSMTVTLDIPAPVGGTDVTLATSDDLVVSVNPSVTVAEGMMDASVTITGVGAGTATITATLGADSFDATVTVAGVLANAGDVAIDEFLALPSGGGNGGEFVELVNLSGDVLNISGWVLDSDGVANAILATSLDPAEPIYVNPGDIIYGVPNPADPANIPANATFVYGPAGSAFDLGDTGSNLRITDGATIVDIVDFIGWETTPGNTPGASQFPGLVDRSTQLDASYMNALDNDDGARWCVPATPTPGAANLPCDAATIDELLPDALGADDDLEFVELRVVPGMDLSGWRLRSTGSDGTPTGLDLVLAAGTRAPLDGFWVVADNTSGTTQVGNADLETVMGLPDDDAGLQLIDPALGAADAVGYGVLGATVDTVDGLPIVEGNATTAAEGSAIARDGNGTDTDQNDTDFQLDPSPTPGTANDV